MTIHRIHDKSPYKIEIKSITQIVFSNAIGIWVSNLVSEIRNRTVCL